MSLSSLLDEIDRAQQQIDAHRPLPPEVEARVFQKLRMEWNYNSNAIEGNTLSLGETRAFLLQGITAGGKPLRDHLDIRGHDRVIDVLVDLVRSEEPLTEALIRELHRLLLGEPYNVKAVAPDGSPVQRKITLGAYKSAPNHVITQTGQTHYYASPESTPAEMHALMDFYRAEHKTRTMHPVLFAADFHYRFVSIHPFDDGNGRMGRILMNLMLMQAGYPPAVFPLETRSAYFGYLEQADAGELEPFCRYLADAVLRAQRLFLRALRGENINTLEDYDKRLALLRDGWKSEPRSERANWTLNLQRDMLRSFIAPIFVAIGDRLSVIADLFSERDLNLVLQTDSLQVYKQSSIHVMVDALLATPVEGQITSVIFHFHGKGMKHNASESFLLRVTVYGHAERLAVTYFCTGRLESEVSGIRWDAQPTEHDVLDVVREILDGLMEALERIHKQASA